MTSVKNFSVDKPATPNALGQGAFIFTDAYSVFDWGKMPDEIPDKGPSLCTMGAFNFELLEASGVPTHYRGVVHDGDIVDLETALAAAPPREMAIDLTQVPDLPHDEDGYDYAAYHQAAGHNYLVPLEVVFRNRVGTGSSLRRRTDPADHGLPFADWPDEVVELDDPIVEFSTKYEEQDRYLERAKADEIAGLAAVADLERLARQVNHLINDRAAAAGLVHQDGKIEVLYVDGDVRIADVVGTFDENRFAYDGQQVSKEVLRQHHKRLQPEWVQAVSAAKAEADDREIADWKSFCDREPAPLAPDVIDATRDLYCAGTNAYTGCEAFDAPALESAVTAIRRHVATK